LPSASTVQVESALHGPIKRLPDLESAVRRMSARGSNPITVNFLVEGYSEYSVDDSERITHAPPAPTHLHNSFLPHIFATVAGHAGWNLERPRGRAGSRRLHGAASLCGLGSERDLGPLHERPAHIPDLKGFGHRLNAVLIQGARTYLQRRDETSDSQLARSAVARGVQVPDRAGRRRGAGCTVAKRWPIPF
jgi:hypothetical protein